MSGGKGFTLRMFALAFALSFMVLASGAAISVWLIAQVGESAEEPSGQRPSGYLPREQDSLTVLLVGSDRPGEPPSYFTMLRFLPHKGQIPVFSFPQQTVFSYDGGRHTLRDIGSVYGAQGVAQAVASGLGVTVDRWVRWDGEGCSEAVNAIGSFDFMLHSDLEYSDAGRIISLTKGLQRVDGKKYLDMVSFPAYESELLRCDMSSKLLASLLKARIGKLAERDGKYFFQALEAVESSITAEDYARCASMFRFYSELSVTISSHVTAEVNVSESGETLLSDLARARIAKYFG